MRICCVGRLPGGPSHSLTVSQRLRNGVLFHPLFGEKSESLSDQPPGGGALPKRARVIAGVSAGPRCQEQGPVTGECVPCVVDAPPCSPVRGHVRCTGRRGCGPLLTGRARPSPSGCFFTEDPGPFRLLTALHFPTVARASPLNDSLGSEGREHVAADGWGGQRPSERVGLPCVYPPSGKSPGERPCYGPPSTPQKRQDGVLTPIASGWGLIWGQALYRDQLKGDHVGGPHSRVTGVVTKSRRWDAETDAHGEESVKRPGGRRRSPSRGESPGQGLRCSP